MRAHVVGRLLARGARELARERRTAVMLLLFPALMVGLMVSAQGEIVSQATGAEGASHDVAVEGVSRAPGLAEALRAARFTIVEVEDARAVVRDHGTSVGLVVPPDFARDLAGGTPARVEILIAERSFKAQFAQTALFATLEGYRRTLAADRLAAHGLSAQLMEPVLIETEDLASERERSGNFLGRILPLMLVAQIVGMMSGVAVDVTAGEKERRTVEALLVAPVTRREILAGKWLLIAGVGIVAGSITLVAAMIAFRTLVAGQIVTTGLTADAIGLSIVAVVAVALTVSSLQLLAGIWARSVQQAGILMMPMMFAVLIPILFLFERPSSSISDAYYAIPIIGPLLMIRYGMTGTAAGVALPLVASVAITVGALALAMTVRLYRSDRALLRAGG